MDGYKMTVSQNNARHIGRPRADVSPVEVLNAYGEYRSIRAAARSLNITSGTAWARLKQLGLTPLGMSPSEAGKLGQKIRRLNQECITGAGSGATEAQEIKKGGMVSVDAGAGPGRVEHNG